MAGLLTRIPGARQMDRLLRTLGELRRTARDVLQQQAEQHVRLLLEGPRYADPRCLARYEHQVFSQSGEDGIIAEILRRIGTTERRFVEIGVGDGLENNTAFLLAQGWGGVWVDADAAALRRAESEFRGPIGEGRLRLVRAFVTAEALPGLLRQAGVPAEPDVASIDIDRNTYYAWESLVDFRPRVVVVEYNATLPPSVDWKVEYDAGKSWNRTMYFGASLAALTGLGERLGYTLVGCGLAGVNAFFVRDDLVGDHFAGPFTAERHYEPPRYWLARTRAGHPRCFSD